MLILIGLSSILGAFGAPGAARAPIGFGGHPAIEGLLAAASGAVIILGCRWWQSRLSDRWMKYSQRAEAAASALATGKLPTEVPTRPLFVASPFVQWTANTPLDPTAFNALLTRDLQDQLRTLLSNAGESQVLVGQSPVVLEDGKLSGAWVVDREWKDGKRTVEWIYAGKTGTRVRLAGGASAHGRFWSKPATFATWAVVGAGCYLGQVLFFVPILLLLGIGQGVRALSPVTLQVSPETLDWLTIPEPLSGFRGTAVTERAAAKARVADAIRSLEPL